MKFGKLLIQTSEDMPEMNNLFLRYKKLKKQLKSIDKAQQYETTPPLQEMSTDLEGQQLSPVEVEFVQTLNEDLSKFNQFFMDKEEDSVIKLQALADAIQQTTSEDHKQQLKAGLVNFHGEMVLLLHWSLLNYAAVVKILKKHDKRTGLLLRAPYLSNVLQQPFYSTSLMSRLVKQAEEYIQQLVVPEPQAAPAPAALTPAAAAASVLTTSAPADAAAPAAEAGIACDDRVLKRTQAALEMWEMLSKSASTPSTVLPLERFVVPAQKLEELHQQLGTAGSQGGQGASDSSDSDSHPQGKRCASPNKLAAKRRKGRAPTPAPAGEHQAGHDPMTDRCEEGHNQNIMQA